eukprot:5002919-Heterocapsa_arctica.AAC.1
MGHEVHICGDTEYCLGCGRSTKAKHIDNAKHVLEKTDWWCCQACEAVGPDMNKRIGFAYNHKRGNAQDPDTDNKKSKNIEEDKYPGVSIRKQATMEAEQTQR